MINPNYNYVDPVANQFVSNIAKGVPHPVNNRNIISEISDNHNLAPYNRENSELFKKKMYSPKLSPSAAFSTESFLKARELFSPIYFHNESITRYLMISALKISASDQKNNVDVMI